MTDEQPAFIGSSSTRVVPRGHPTEGNSMMSRTRSFRNLTCISLLTLFAALAAAAAASSAINTRIPAALGKVCGHVNGAGWKFQGQTGIRHSVVGQGGSCRDAMKLVAGLTKQTPHTGALGRQTLIGYSGYQCAGSGIPLAHAGSCGRGAAHFIWAPQLTK